MPTLTASLLDPLEEDLEAIAQDANISWSDLVDATVLVTGATGFLGSLLCKALLHASTTNNLRIRVLAQIRNREKAESVFAGTYSQKREDLIFIEADIQSPFTVDFPVDYVIHTAAPTSSAFMLTRPLETLLSIINGTQHVLELAQSKNVRSCLYLSTMEVYGQLDHEKVSEDEYGYVDILKARSSYPMGKRCAEAMCAAFWHEHQMPVKIARLTLTFGPGVAYEDPRVFAQFARAVIEGRDITLETKGEAKRDYIYSSDAIRGLLTILLKGKNGEAYNLSNENTYCSIFEMAEKCASISNKIQVRIEESNSKKYPPSVKIHLNSAKSQSLGITCSVNFHKMFIRTIVAMKKNFKIN